MKENTKSVKYPENLMLKETIKQSGYKITALAKKIGVSRVILSNTINGHFKGARIIEELNVILNK